MEVPFQVLGAWEVRLVVIDETDGMACRVGSRQRSHHGSVGSVLIPALYIWHALQRTGGD